MHGRYIQSNNNRVEFCIVSHNEIIFMEHSPMNTDVMKYVYVAAFAFPLTARGNLALLS